MWYPGSDLNEEDEERRGRVWSCLMEASQSTRFEIISDTEARNA
jgi:hypothetical protein